MTPRDKGNNHQDHIQSNVRDKRLLWPSQILRYFITVILSGLIINWVSEPSRNILIKIYEGAQSLLLSFINASILNQTYKSIAGNSLINIGDLTSTFSSAATIAIGAMFFLLIIENFTSFNFLEKWSNSILIIIVSIVVISNIFLIQHRQNAILFFRQSIIVLSPFCIRQRFYTLKVILLKLERRMTMRKFWQNSSF